MTCVDGGLHLPCMQLEQRWSWNKERSMPFCCRLSVRVALTPFFQAAHSLPACAPYAALCITKSL